MMQEFEFNGMKDFLGYLVNRITGNSCFDCSDIEQEDIGELDPSEMEDWNAINAEADRLINELKKLSRAKMLVESRRDVFWLKLELRFGFINNERLDIVNGYKLVKLLCKTDSCKKSQLPFNQKGPSTPPTPSPEDE